METIRFALIGKQDLRIGTGKFEVMLADGRKALLDEINLADLITPLTANIDGDDFGIFDLGFLSIGNARLGTTAPLDVGDTDTRTNTVKIAAAFWANTTGVPAAEIGTSIKLQAESADEDPADAVELQGVLTTITAGAEESDLRVRLRTAGAALAEKFRLKGTGAAILGAAADPDAAALLELRSTTKGFLPPRVTTAQKNAIAAPPTGLVVYDTTTVKLNVYDGTAWDELEPATTSLPIYHCLPVAAAFPTTNFPQLVKNSGTNWTNYTLDFDQTTSESAFWYFLIPAGIIFSGATLEIYSRQAAAVTGTAGWTITTLTRADGEAFDTAGVADTVTAATVKGTAGQVLRQSQALTITGWAASEILQVKIARDIADTVAEDVKLIGALLRLTA